jgi:hypothetical protein
MNISQLAPSTDKSSILVMYDVRIPGIAELLHRLRDTLQDYGTLEAIDQNHFVLVIWPGAALEVA